MLFAHTQSLIDQRDRMRTGCGLYLSLSLSYHTHIHTHTHTHIKSARTSHASQQCCKWPRIWFAAVEVFRGIKCNLNKEATSSLSLHFVVFLSISISHTHTHTIIDRSTRQNADWMWFVSLSLSLTTLTYTHTSNLLGFLMLHSMLQLATDLVRSGGSISRN